MRPLIVVDNLRIAEVEVSITRLCTLRCEQCGFLVPHQPAPTVGEPVEELSRDLLRLRELGLGADRLVVVGGEPTIDSVLLERATLAFRSAAFARQIEVVSNGLTPQGLTPRTLAAIDRFTISVYGLGPDLLDLWRRWVAAIAPHVEVVLRHSAEGWDRWTSDRRVSAERAQEMYDACWYRKHCVTVERGRIFACSRVAKLERDGEGLPIAQASLQQVIEYLHSPHALPSCATCAPMMGLPVVQPGLQPDNRIQRLECRACLWLERALAGAGERRGAS